MLLGLYLGPNNDSSYKYHPSADGAPTDGALDFGCAEDDPTWQNDLQSL